MTLHDQDVPALWRDLGLPGLADIHVHFLPDRVLDKVWAFFDSVEQLGGPPWPIAYRYDEDRRLEIVRTLGLKGIPSLTYAHKPGMAGWLNEWCTEFAARVPDAIHSGTLYAEPTAPAYVRAAVDAGARLFKVHVQVGNFAPDDRVLDGAWDVLQDNSIPVVTHCGSGPHGGAHTGVDPIRRLLARFPRLTLVIAHAGLPEYNEFADLAAQFDNVHLDTTMVGTDFTEAMTPMPPGYASRLADLQHKVVLGSDFPNIPYPYAHQLESLQRLELGDDWMRDVLWHSGARLMRLPQADHDGPLPTAHETRQ
ncbi:amidohydrolase family protein [Luteipulveratus mongoliensis]|uniref:Hydrolase n=1 Tax=Luteipulveratus mongoliensis TaxID=571913 RepID=A0A0K1JI36_9MICO|nr:amidohydrolase family protein [Luteipulveratus mongoliensis]AKU16371.1 hydrolase [Luteipulveratus mongoliensis]